MNDIILGLSGGVDSAVAARLLQAAGYTVRGVYLDIGDAAARQDARNTAAFLGIDLEVADVTEALEREVCAPFAAAYLRGETPNPCILCNPAVKLALLLRRADALGGCPIATGHYARAEGGRLLRGHPDNDQSYMLCRLLPEQLRRLILPLGGYPKTEVRAMAHAFGLPTADKPDSMEICYIPDGDYAAWLSRRGLTLPGPGDFVRDGAVIGRHEGIHRWTVGQRIPGLYGGEKLYVSAIRPDSGEIAVCPDSELYRSVFRVRDFRWLGEAPAEPVRGSVRVRHSRRAETDCTAVPLADGGVEIRCAEPVRAPAPGQTAALYAGELVLGGGTIERCAEADACKAI